MKICAVTMVYRDYWALSQWYAHYSRQIGAENLFVVAHGRDERVSKLCPMAHVITVPGNDMTEFDKRRNDMLNSMQRELNSEYDWVIRTDADELICYDPTVVGSFEELLSNRTSDAVFALGLNIAERSDDTDLLGDENVFSKRTRAMMSGHYSKAWAVRNGCGIDLHGVVVEPERIESFEYDLPKGVFLAHLKFANIAELVKSNIKRRAIARGKVDGLPGTAWRNANKISKQFFEKAERYPQVDWLKAEADAYDAQSTDPKRNRKSGVIRGKFNDFKFKTTLPDWFGNTN